MVVGYAHHGITSHIAHMVAQGHDISIISPDEAKAMGDVEGMITLPYHAPAPIPILEEPFVVSERYQYEYKSGRQERNEKRKAKRKKKRRY